MVGWHHQFNRHAFVWTPGVGDGLGGLACCSSWVHKESDMTEWQNWTELNWYLNGLVVFPTFFNLSLNFASRSSWSKSGSAPSLVFADGIELLHLQLHIIYNQSDFAIDHLVMSKCRVVSVLLKEGVCYDQCVLLAELLAFDLLCFVFQGQIFLLLQVSLDFLLLHSSPL